jgi:hypothetical protein
MLFSRSSLTTSLAIWVSLLICFAPYAHAERTQAVKPGAFCSTGFGRLGHIKISGHGPALVNLRKDLYDLNDPIEFVRSFNEKRNAWNLLNPLDRNNFPVPEMQNGADKMIALLRKVRRPPENRAAAEMYIRKLEQLKRDGLPYRDSVLSIHEASEVLALKNPKPGEPTLKVIDIPNFRTKNAADYAAITQMMETEIFVVTGRKQSVEGLAESSLLGVRALEVAEPSAKIDNMWMNPRERLEHDVAHAMMSVRDKTTAAIRTLPIDDRIEILQSVEKLDAHHQQLARFAIYQTTHEPAEEGAVRLLYEPRSILVVQAEYRDVFKREISIAEARWIQEWYRQNLGRRVAERLRPVQPYQ